MSVERKFDHTSYTITEYEDFLSEEECRVLVEFTLPRLIESRVYEAKVDNVDHNIRISDQTWIHDHEHNAIVDQINRRIEAIVQIPPDRYEALQVVRYKPGGFYRPHHDACTSTPADCKRMNEPFQAQRYLTFLIYLNDDFTGGGTHFPTLKYTTQPKRGMAVLFQNTDSTGKVLPDSLHGGDPVKQGEKWICNKWIHYPTPQAEYELVERFSMVRSISGQVLKNMLWIVLCMVIIVLGVRWWFVRP
jgi:prolyl 4-hydroxylase